MLQFIFGRAGSGKTLKIHEIIRELLPNNDSKWMLIVPEQSSFDTEKNILDSFGAQNAAKIQVATFTRLIDLVSRELGGENGKRINKGYRNLLMSLAVDEVADKLDIYSKRIGKTEFIELMVAALSEFKMCNVKNNSILEILQKVDDPILKGKLQETALILEAYENLLENAYIDPLDDLTKVAQKLSGSDFFSNYTVILDGFEGFTMQQISILEIILKQCKSCYVTLCAEKDAFSDDKMSLFSPINRTARRILNLAKRNSIEVKTPIYLEKSKKFNSEGLKMLEAQIFRIKKEKLLTKIDDVFLFNGNTKYDEADFICCTIKKFVYTGKYKYNDFAVITRNDEIYRGILDVAFEKYKIPYFMDKREEISSKPLMMLVCLALEIINSNFSSQTIFKYFKTGLAGIGIDEISELENYVLFWNITGKRWLTEFSASPDGYAKMSAESESKLSKINSLRAKVIIPLLKLKQSVADTTGAIITKKIYEFLCEIDIINELKKFCGELNRTNKPDLANEQVKLWDLLVEILDEMAVVLKGKKVTLRKFAELLKLVMASHDIATIPPRMDEVAFGSIDRIRAQGKKIVFLIGAVEGEFPRVPAVSGIFTDAQRKQLISMGLPLYDDIEGLSVNERFLAYRAVTMPTEKLYITWYSTTSLGGVKSASEIVREAKFILPSAPVLDEFSLTLEDKIWASEPAFELCARHWNDKSRFSETLKQYFAQVDGQKEKLNAIRKVTSNLPFKIENVERTKALFGETMKISASQVEKFYLCKFAYFCKYGLLAKERSKARFDALQYGAVVHFIFEKVLKKFSAEQLLNFSKKELFLEVKKVLKVYVEQNLGGWTDKSDRFGYLFNRVVGSVIPLIEHMAKELIQSKFVPVGFEIKLSDNALAKPLKLKLDDGTTVLVKGQVDRVDVMEHNGKKYVRVIDYKTGAKEFRLSDIFYGLNLQMLIYLEALCSNSAEKIVPAGVLYFPSVSTVLNLDRDESFAKLEKEKMKKMCMNGLVLDDERVILGMEPDGEGVYIPVAVKDGKLKNYESVANVAQMREIMQHINDLIISMGMQLRNGVINAQPAKCDYDACEFCEYKTVCAPLKDEESVKVEHFNKDELFEKLKQNRGEEDV